MPPDGFFAIEAHQAHPQVLTNPELIGPLARVGVVGLRMGSHPASEGVISLLAGHMGAGERVHRRAAMPLGASVGVHRRGHGSHAAGIRVETGNLTVECSGIGVEALLETGHLRIAQGRTDPAHQAEGHALETAFHGGMLLSRAGHFGSGCPAGALMGLRTGFPTSFRLSEPRSLRSLPGSLPGSTV